MSYTYISVTRLEIYTFVSFLIFVLVVTVDNENDYSHNVSHLKFNAQALLLCDTKTMLCAHYAGFNVDRTLCLQIIYYATLFPSFNLTLF